MATTISVLDFRQGPAAIADYAAPTWNGLADDLGVTRRAHQARKRLQRGDAETLGAAEAEIDNRCHRHFDALSRHCRARQDQALREDAALTSVIEGHAAVVEHIRQDGLDEAVRLAGKANLHLTNLKHQETAAAKDLAAFRLLHQREFDAQYPASRFLHVTVLIIMVIVETTLNAYFFKEDGELGGLGGIVKALLVSVANILFAFVFGGLLLLRQMRHIGWFHQVTAFLLFLPFVGVVVGFNLLIAHYRAHLERDPDSAMTAAWVSWLAQPMQLGSVSATVLFILGVIAAAVACLDGLFIDDPYPGFGRIDRRYRDAISECDEALGKAEQDLGGLTARQKSRLDQQRDAVAKAFAHREDVLRELTRISETFTQGRRQLVELRQTAHARFQDLTRTGMLGPDAGVAQRMSLAFRRLISMPPTPLPPEMLVREGSSATAERALGWAAESLPTPQPGDVRTTRQDAMAGCDAALAAIRERTQELQQSLRDLRGVQAAKPESTR